MKVHLVALLLAALPTAASAADPFAGARTVPLPNGLTVLLAPDSTAVSVGVGVWVRAGSRFESAGTAGITHLIERLMFMGTAKAGPGQFARRVQAEGGNAGAFTAADHTCFETVVPPAALETVLRLEADRFAALDLTQPKLDAARRTLLDQSRGRADQTGVGRALKLLYATAFAGHPYRFPVAGLDDDLRGLTLKQVQAYRAARYVPGRMVVTLAGRFETASALAAVKRTLGALPGAALAPERAAAPGAGERRASVIAEATLPVLAMGWRTPPLADADTPALEVLARVFAAGGSSRIQRLLVRADSGSCVMAQGTLDARAAGGLLYALASPRPGVDTSRVERELTAAAAALTREPVSEAELEAGKRQVEADLLFSWQTPAGVGRELGAAWLATGDARAPAQRLERVRAVTAADLQRVAARVLVPAGRTVTWISPATRSEEGR